ncbi:hypothetical protein BLNAU_4404 [Blattamonas nauphoetae]|uniref:Uncharacterized protein n=1 Tax=Blattamonas nauphoetae TaxID=2049346 RepID=A0ABQ9Y9Q0_9EUKA|nr:hypothetical protein BLNAU_4404 [Blattamonas nauphoetae]
MKCKKLYTFSSLFSTPKELNSTQSPLDSSHSHSLSCQISSVRPSLVPASSIARYVSLQRLFSPSDVLIPNIERGDQIPLFLLDQPLFEHQLAPHTLHLRGLLSIRLLHLGKAGLIRWLVLLSRLCGRVLFLGSVDSSSGSLHLVSTSGWYEALPLSQARACWNLSRGC